MRHHATPVHVLSLAVLVALSATPLFADAPSDRAPGGWTNLLVTITSGKIEGGEKVPVKTYRMIVGNNERTELLDGRRVPIPVTTFTAEVKPIVPVTSYTYQNVGFAAQVKARDDGEAGIFLSANIEDSRVAGRDPLPQIEARQRKVQATLRRGVPTEILRTETPGSETTYVEVTAERLD